MNHEIQNCCSGQHAYTWHIVKRRPQIDRSTFACQVPFCLLAVTRLTDTGVSRVVARAKVVDDLMVVPGHEKGLATQERLVCGGNHRWTGKETRQGADTLVRTQQCLGLCEGAVFGLTFANSTCEGTTYRSIHRRCSWCCRRS